MGEGMVIGTTATITVIVAVIALVQLLLLTGLNGWLTNKQDRRTAELRAKEKAEDYKRQDEVAARVAQAAAQTAAAADLLVKAQAATTLAAEDVAKQVQDTAREVTDRAQLLLEAQTKTTIAAEEVARLAVESDKRIQAGLQANLDLGQKIHILVNSDMTAARTAERDSLKLLVLALRNTLALTSQLGIITSPEDKDRQEKEIAEVAKRITELDQILTDRHAAQKRVEEQTKQAAAKLVNGPESGT